MANKGIICTTNQVEYSTIRQAMIAGARSIDDLKAAVSVCGTCDGCKENLDYITTTLCGCKGVSMQTVIDLVQDGVDSVEEIVSRTGAGTGEECGRCKKLIANVIEQGY